MPTADALFPPDFVWGASTSAYQIEGAARDDGRGPSIWDIFSHMPGKIADGTDGDIACDSYHRFPADIASMRELGLGAYRFSIAWPRIIPDGRGRINEAGLDHYRRLIDALHAAGIEPFVTLYHWELPQPLQDAGGWTNRDTASRFGEYVHVVARALGTGVHRWMTINEPFIHSVFGHLLGIHAPGLRGVRPALAAGHHLLLAHADGMDALRAEMAPGDEAGIALILAETAPASDRAADLEAAEHADVYANQWFLDPIFRGAYPTGLLLQFGDDMPEMRADDLRRIAQPIDFLGINHYQRAVVRHAPLVPPIDIVPVTPQGAPVTASGWEIYPRGIYDTLTRVHRDYAPRAIYITENGAACDDRPIDGVIDDPERERYIHDYLLASLDAIEAGVPLRGYFVWSLLDNFEWNEGYRRRFGLVYVDFATQERTIKRSGRWYAQVTRDNGLSG